MCEAFDVTARTLRFYEQKELLTPQREGQRRLYSRRDRARLKLILRGKKFGVSLEEIRQLLDLYTNDAEPHLQVIKSVETAHRRLAEMVEQRQALDAAIAELSAHIAEGERMLASITKSSAA